MNTPLLSARYAHTNLTAEDWEALAAFYERVFGCTRTSPQRDYQDEALSGGQARAPRQRGVHLRLPGHGPGGPTLEIFGYDPLTNRARTAPNRPGFGHIAFEVPDVAAARAVVVAEGGSALGEVVTQMTPLGRAITWAYVADPECNVIELQSWTA
ncbi:VOC family protein [Hymenobacter jeollabukensis]|uniref:VOC family protein n=1 Tax=Hymenobacter jeollabukensis TaxID=2025313 RepID=A0A5R8WQ17_9BACT|nr:VOC family protein [Hymenobacter jeollabukensis]TLM92388.1 VOC family protein [Hymenobacter jeollabukensis]